MDATKHIRILSHIYLAVGASVFALSGLVFAWAVSTSGEGALMAVPAGAVAVVAFPVLLAGLGLRSDAGWGLAIAVVLAVPMLFTLILSPLAIYTFMIAYVRWSAPRVPHAEAPSYDTAERTAAPASVQLNTETEADASPPAALWLLAALFPLYIIVVLFGGTLLETLFSMILLPIAAFVFLTAVVRRNAILGADARSTMVPRRVEVAEMLRDFRPPADAGARARILDSLWILAAVVPFYVMVTLVGTSSLKTFFGILLSPLAAYTVAVAYVWYRTPVDGSAGIADLPGRAQLADAAFSIANPNSQRAHVRILASLWIAFSLFPFWIGAVLLAEGLQELSDRGWYSYDVYSGAALIVCGVAVLAIARGLIHQRLWAVITGAIASLLVVRMWPLGTLIAVYSSWTAYMVWRASRPLPPRESVA